MDLTRRDEEADGEEQRVTGQDLEEQPALDEDDDEGAIAKKALFRPRSLRTQGRLRHSCRVRFSYRLDLSGRRYWKSNATH